MEKAQELQEQTGTRIGESYELVEKEEYDGLTIVTTEKGSFAAKGRFRVTEFSDKETIKGLISNRDYDLLLNLFILIAEDIWDLKRGLMEVK